MHAKAQVPPTDLLNLHQYGYRPWWPIGLSFSNAQFELPAPECKRGHMPDTFLHNETIKLFNTFALCILKNVNFLSEPVDSG
jgi:hypothetical protein